jgi:uncharacterized protein (DUF302 family)
MHFFSKRLAMSFDQAVAATKTTLERQEFAVLAEADVREALKQHLGVDFRRYTVLSTCSLNVLRHTLRDTQDTPVWLSNIVIQDQGQGCVEVSAVDPASTVGTMNDIDAVRANNELRSHLWATIEAIGGPPPAAPVRQQSPD